MTAYDYDLLVIGAGSGGVRAARMAASTGVRVAVVEEKYLGGTCVNVGCVPKKLMVYASHFAEDFHDAKGYGWQLGEASFDWKTLISNKNREISRLNGIYENLLVNAGVTIIRGRARLVGPNTVVVDGKSISAEKILLTVGCTPQMVELPGSEHAISSDQVFFLDALPKKMVIVGGGYIAVEFAGIFNGLGVETHLIYRGDKILKQFDNAIGDFAAAQMQQKGIHIHYKENVEAIEKQADGILRCQLQNGGHLDVDQVFYATGRKALSADLGLENTQVQIANNAVIKVNTRFQSHEPSIFALGDVIGTPELTPVALAQAMVFVNQQFGDNSKLMNYDNIATAVFCQPNIATVGLSEEAAIAKGLDIDVYVSEFKHLKHTLSGNSERVLMKMLVDSHSHVVIGMHMVGPEAGEIIQGFAVAVKAGLSKAQVDDTIGIHPTAAEEFVTLRQSSYSRTA